MAMSLKAQNVYDAALLAAVLKHGVLVEKNPDIYSWMDLDWKHVRVCQVTTTDKPVEDHWNEFMGSFYEGDTSVHGIVLNKVSCACGKLKNRSLRLQGSVSEIAEAVFEEAFGGKS
jgi:hypothetical protein